MGEEAERNLTEDDVKALVTEFREQMVTQFFQDLGRGIWGLFRASFLIVVLSLMGWAAWLQSKD